MSNESKLRIGLVLFFSFLSFLAGVYAQGRVDRWHQAERARYYRAAAQWEAQHPSNPDPVLLDGVWFCFPPSKWYPQRQDGGSHAVVCVSNHFIPMEESQ